LRRLQVWRGLELPRITLPVATWTTTYHFIADIFYNAVYKMMHKTSRHLFDD